MAAGSVEIEAGKVAQEQPSIAFEVLQYLHVHRRCRLTMREATDAEDAHRVALLGHQQGFAQRIVGQAFQALVAVQANAQRQLRRAGGVEYPGVAVEAHLDQALGALVGDHEQPGGDVFDGFRIGEAAQFDGAQQFAVQRQLHQLRRLVGDTHQHPPLLVEGQRGKIVGQPFHRLGLDLGAVARQPERTLAALVLLEPGERVEPGPLEQAELLASQHGQQQQDGRQRGQRVAQESMPHRNAPEKSSCFLTQDGLREAERRGQRATSDRRLNTKKRLGSPTT